VLADLALEGDFVVETHRLQTPWITSGRIPERERWIYKQRVLETLHGRHE
jgi:hypothetical protein